MGRPLVLHAANGSAQKGNTLLATLQALGIVPSHSRPRVSDDNPCSEALFRTCIPSGLSGGRLCRPHRGTPVGAEIRVRRSVSGYTRR
jgi:transposase InsO family protein